ncbi:MAG: hypothetical protein ABSB29_02065 [Nitrososphaerales archaeon]
MTKTGSFQAIGWEATAPTLKFFLPLAGVLQIFGVVFLSEMGSWYLDVAERILFPSLLVLVVSFLVLGVQAVVSTRSSLVGTYLVSFIDRREEGGKLELSFEKARGRKRGLMVVESVAAKQGRLYRPGYRFPHPVEGTSASIKVKFEGHQGGLELGFASIEKMNEVYLQLVGAGEDDTSIDHW